MDFLVGSGLSEGLTETDSGACCMLHAQWSVQLDLHHLASWLTMDAAYCRPQGTQVQVNKVVLSAAELVVVVVATIATCHNIS